MVTDLLVSGTLDKESVRVLWVSVQLHVTNSHYAVDVHPADIHRRLVHTAVVTELRPARDGLRAIGALSAGFFRFWRCCLFGLLRALRGVDERLLVAFRRLICPAKLLECIRLGGPRSNVGWICAQNLVKASESSLRLTLEEQPCTEVKPKLRALCFGDVISLLRSLLRFLLLRIFLDSRIAHR